EFSHGCHDGADVDEGIGCCLTRFRNAHALFDDALHTQQADAELGLDQFANATDAAIAKVIDVVWTSMAVISGDEAANDVDDVVQGQDVVSQWDGEVEFPVEFVTTDSAEVVAASVEEKVVDEGACVVRSGRITRTQFPVDFEEGFAFCFYGVAVQR